MELLFATSPSISPTILVNNAYLHLELTAQARHFFNNSCYALH